MKRKLHENDLKWQMHAFMDIPYDFNFN